ncbi:MAG: MFS transporter [Candidatus Limnocylindrales bacterium]
MSIRARITGVGVHRLSLYLTIFLTQLGVSVAVPILPSLKEEFGLTVAAVSLTTAFWGLARLVFDLPVGKLLARVSTGRMLFVGVLSLGLGAITSALAPTFEIILVGRVISGAGAAMLAITTTLALLALSTPNNRGRVLGIHQAALQAGAAASPVVAGIASELFGWRAAFLVAGIGALGGLSVLLIAGRITDAAASREPVVAELPHRVRRSPLWLDLLLANVATFVLFFITAGIFSNVMPLYGDRLGLDAAGIGLIIGISTGLRVVVSVIGSLVSDRHGRHGVLLIGFVVTFASLLLFPLVTNVAAFAILIWVMSLGRVGNTMPITILSDRLPAAQHNRWISRNRFIADLAVFVGPVVLGVAVDAAGFDTAFYIAAVLVGATIAIMLAEWRANRRGSASAAGAAPA